MSANTPPGRPKKKDGRLTAVCTRATISGEVVSVSIIQAAPTFCIQSARLTASAPSHSQQNAFTRNGAQGPSFIFSAIRPPHLSFDPPDFSWLARLSRCLELD